MGLARVPVASAQGASLTDDVDLAARDWDCVGGEELAGAAAEMK